MLKLCGFLFLACLSFTNAIKGGDAPDDNGNRTALSVFYFYTEGETNSLCYGVLLNYLNALSFCGELALGRLTMVNIRNQAEERRVTAVAGGVADNFEIAEVWPGFATRHADAPTVTDIYPKDKVHRNDEVFVVGLKTNQRQGVLQLKGVVVSPRNCRAVYDHFTSKEDICVEFSGKGRLSESDLGLPLWCMIDGRYRVCGMLIEYKKKTAGVYYFHSFNANLRKDFYRYAKPLGDKFVMYKLENNIPLQQFGMFQHSEMDLDTYVDDVYCIDNTCDKSYRNRWVDFWGPWFTSSFQPGYFYLEMFQDGVLKHWFQFHGTDPNPEVWFNETNLVNASYWDVGQGFQFTLNRWSLYSYVVEGKNQVECYTGELYMAVVKQAGHCPWGLLQSPANVVYNKEYTPSQVSSTSSFDVATVFKISYKAV